MANPEIDNGPTRLRKFTKVEGLPALLGQVSAGIKQPEQIPEYALPVALEGNDPLRPALLLVLRLVVCQSVEQAGLEFFDDRQFRHGLGS